MEKRERREAMKHCVYDYGRFRFEFERSCAFYWCHFHVCLLGWGVEIRWFGRQWNVIAGYGFCRPSKWWPLGLYYHWSTVHAKKAGPNVGPAPEE